MIRTPLTSAALITIFDPVADERELEVLTPLSASGRVASEIAGDLFVAVDTVRSHVNNIYRKLGAAKRTQGVTRARERNPLR